MSFKERFEAAYAKGYEEGYKATESFFNFLSSFKKSPKNSNQTIKNTEKTNVKTVQEPTAKILETKERKEKLGDHSYSNSFFSTVAGVTYEGRQEYVKKCRPGQELELIREKMNVHDRNAIAVYAGDNQVGYIKKEIAANMAPKMDSGTKYKCFVEKVTGQEYNNYGINIKICEYNEESNTSKPSFNSNKEESIDYSDYDDYKWDQSDIADYYGYDSSMGISPGEFLDDL